MTESELGLGGVSSTTCKGQWAEWLIWDSWTERDSGLTRTPWVYALSVEFSSAGKADNQRRHSANISKAATAPFDPKWRAKAINRGAGVRRIGAKGSATFPRPARMVGA